MGRKHKQTKAIAAAKADETDAPSAASAVASPTYVDAFHLEELASRALCGHAGYLARLVESLRLGAFAGLSSVECVRLARVSRVTQALAEALAADLVVARLRGSMLLHNAPTPRDRPLLALSHLESLARSQFALGAARELLALCGGQEQASVVLEVDGGRESVTQAIATLAFSEALTDVGRHDRILSSVDTLLSQYKPPQGEVWSSALLRALESRVRRCPVEELNTGLGESLQAFLHGAADLLPITRTAQAATAETLEPFMAAKLCCELLERLLYPADKAALVLRFSYPAAELTGIVETTQVLTPEAVGDGCTPAGEGDTTVAGHARVTRQQRAPASGFTSRLGDGGAGEVQDTCRRRGAEERPSNAKVACLFTDTLRSLQAEVALSECLAPFEVWVLAGVGVHLVLLLE